MVKIKDPDITPCFCNGCLSSKDIQQIEITRKYKGTMFFGDTGFSILLCPACCRELKEALEQAEVEMTK